MGLLTWTKRRRADRGAGLDEARAARQRVRHDRQESAARRPEVTAVTSRLRGHLERNRFAERIERALGGGT